MRPSGPSASPVGTGSQPTVPGLFIRSPQAATSAAPTTGGTKKVLTSPLSGSTDRTAFAPASATSTRSSWASTANGLDSESTGTPSTNCTWPSGLFANSYSSRLIVCSTVPSSGSAISSDSVTAPSGTGGPGCPGGGGVPTATYSRPSEWSTPCGL